MIRWLGLPGCLVIVFFGGQFAPQRATAQVDGPLIFRRVYVPQDALDHQIRGLLPLKREEFERRLALASKAASHDASASRLRIEEANFRARLDSGVGSGQLIDGTAELHVIASADAPALLPIAPCNIAVTSAIWSDIAKPAVIGVDATGQLQCLVEKSGTLQLAWTHAAQVSESRETVFVLSLPESARRRLEITAPSNVELAIDNGVLIAKVAADDSQLRCWQFLLAGGSQTRLRVLREPPDGQLEIPFVIRESTTYSVLGAGIDVETALDFEGISGPLNEIILEADKGLRITAIQADESDLPFRVEADRDAPRHRVVVALPSHQVDSRLSLQISAVADGSHQTPRALPRVCSAVGLFQEGRAVITAPPWLRLHAMPMQGCIQTSSLAATAGRSVDRFELQLYDSAARIEIAADERARALQAQSGTQIAIDTNQVRGVMITELTATSGSAFDVVAQVPGQWIVDAIEVQPPQMLADRFLTTLDGGAREVRIKLTRPITLQRPLRVVVRAHHRRPANGSPLTEDFYEIVRFPEVQTTRRLVGVRINDPGIELERIGNLDRMDPAGLTPAEMRLFEASPGPLLFESSPRKGFQASLQTTSARYRADVLTSAHLAQGGKLGHTVKVHCEPEVSAVGSVLVRLSPRPRAEIAWHMAGQPNTVFTAVAEDQSGSQTDEALYRVELHGPQSESFDLVGQWSSVSNGPWQVTLATAPESARQTGLLEIHSSEPGIRIHASHLQALPLPADSAERFSTLRSRFRYVAGRQQAVLIEPPNDQITERGAWIERLLLTSQFALDGSGQHEAEFSIRNAGLSEFRLELTDAAKDCRLVLNGGAEQPLAGVGDNHTIVVPLPDGQRNATLRVRYSSSGSLTSVWPYGSLSAPIPQPDIAVLALQWRAGLAPGLSAIESRRSTVHAEASAPPAVSPLANHWFWKTIRGPALLSNLFRAPTNAIAHDRPFVGWQVHEADLTPGSPATIRVYRTSVLIAWSICFSLISLALVLKWQRPVRWYAAAMFLCMAAAVISSPPHRWLLFGVGCGLLAGLLFTLLRRKAIDASVRPPDRSSRILRLSPVSQATPVFLFLACVATGWLTSAAEEEKLRRNEAQPRVICPIGEDQHPVGDYVYVEDRLYDALLRATDHGLKLQANWLLEQASYVLTSPPTLSAQRAAVEEVKAVLEFHALEPGAEVHFPFHRGEILLLEGSARLDGQPITVHWTPDGHALTFTAGEPGRHRLELTFGAVAQVVDHGVALHLHVPPAGASHLTLHPEAEVLSPATARSMIDGALRCVLPNVDRLDVRWALRSRDQSAMENTVHAEQLLWWKFRPASVVVDAKFKLRSSSGPIREALIEVDRRLRLIPASNIAVSNVTASNVTASDVADESSSANLVRITFDESSAADREIQLSWAWPGAMGIGDYLLPHIKIRAEAVHRDWTAVSMGTELQASARERAAGGVGSEDFFAAWGDRTATDLFVVGPSDDLCGHAVGVRPAVALAQVEQSTDWSISRATAHFRCTADIRDAPRWRFEHVIEASDALRISNVTLSQAGRPAAIHWRKQDGKLVVWLLEGPANLQTLTIEGEMDEGSDHATISLPDLNLANAAASTSRVRLYRQADVRVEVPPDSAWRKADAGDYGSLRENFGRLEAAFNKQGGGGAALTVTRSPNDPELKGQIFIRPEEADGQWLAAADLNLRITGGVVDELHLTIPDHWLGPFEIEPAMEQRKTIVAGEPRHRLTLRPPQALAGDQHIRIRAMLSTSAGEAQAPNVKLQNAPALERYLLLDAGSDSASIDWEMSGLQPLVMSPDAMPAAWRGSETAVYRAIGPHFEAIARLRRSQTTAPRANLIDLSAHLQSGRRIDVTALLTIDPRGARQMTFSLPPGCRLVQTLVDGALAPCTPRGIRTWTVEAPSDVLPYEMTVVYSTTAPANAVFRLQPPAFENLEVRSTVWAIRNDVRRTEALELPINGKSPQVSAEAAAIARLKAAVYALEAVGLAQTSNVPSHIVAESYARWVGEVEREHACLLRVTPDTELSAEATAEAESSQTAIARIRQRLVHAGVLDEEQQIVPHWPSQIESAESTVHYVVPGEPPDLTLKPSRPSGIASAAPFIAIGLAVAACLSLCAARSGVAARLRLDHPATFVGGCGAAWWLLAPLGWLGAMLVLLAIWLAVRWPIRVAPIAT